VEEYSKYENSSAENCADRNFNIYSYLGCSEGLSVTTKSFQNDVLLPECDMKPQEHRKCHRVLGAVYAFIISIQTTALKQFGNSALTVWLFTFRMFYKSMFHNIPQIGNAIYGTMSKSIKQKKKNI
jgi:hypothetical protein